MAEVYYDVDLIDPQFEVFKDEEGKYRFRLRSPDGEILSISPAFDKKDDCTSSIGLVKTHAPSASIQDMTG